MDKVKLKLNETNELKFKLYVQGTTSDPDGAKPQFRFVVTERGNGIGYVFPMETDADNVATINLEGDDTRFNENKTYEGKIEVLLGTRYFTPNAMEITFEREFSVAAEPLSEVIKRESESKDFSVSSHIIQNSTKKPQQPKKPEAKKPQVVENKTAPEKTPKISFHKEDFKNVKKEADLRRVVEAKVDKEIGNSPKKKVIVELYVKKLKPMVLKEPDIAGFLGIDE